MQGHASSVQYFRKLDIPLILLGGGGYAIKNVARVWTYETACALGIEDTIDPNLPWNEYFEWFGPRYRLEVVASNMDDLNVRDGSLDDVRLRLYLFLLEPRLTYNGVRAEALRQLDEIIPVPSVQMQDVPSETLGHHLGLEQEEYDELDHRLARTYIHIIVYLPPN